jgi:L-amino acid N-acyltransferase YncA
MSGAMAVDIISIRNAEPWDAEAISAIYAHHVLHGTATFDTEPPSDGFWAEKIGGLTDRGWPFLVADQDGAVVGYAYATQFRDRPAYAQTCENSIYIDSTKLGQGIGSQLLTALVSSARAAGFRQMIAVIGGGGPASMALHSKAGFRESGRMTNVGLKFGQLLDTVYMQLDLGGT